MFSFLVNRLSIRWTIILYVGSLFICNWQYEKHIHFGGANAWTYVDLRLLSFLFSLIFICIGLFEIRKFKRLLNLASIDEPSELFAEREAYFCIYLSPLLMPSDILLSFAEKGSESFIAHWIHFGGIPSIPIVMTGLWMIYILLRIRLLSGIYSENRVVEIF